METMNLDQFRGAFRAGGFRSVRVTASGGVFFVTGEPRAGGGGIRLATTRGATPRGFRDAGKAIAILHRIGARKVRVDTTDWTPDAAGSGAPRRPDTAERQRRAHQAAAHDAWFRTEVEQALLEADAPGAEWVSNEEVKLRSIDARDRWRRGARGSE